MLNSPVVCVDASLVVRFVTSDASEQMRELWRTWLNAAHDLLAPTLLSYELTNALYRYQRAGTMDAESVDEAQRIAMRLPITLYGDRDLHRRALALADRLSLPAAYDAHYLALAERLDAELWTADRRLASRAQPEMPWVNLAE